MTKNIKCKTRKPPSSEESIRITLDGLRCEDSNAELCRKESIAEGHYHKWSKDFLEVSKKRLHRPVTYSSILSTGTQSWKLFYSPMSDISPSNSISSKPNLAMS